MIKRLFLFSIPLFILVLNGCTSHNFTSPLLTDVSDAGTPQDQVLKNLSVAINPSKDNSRQWQFEHFIERLRKADIFKEVDYADKLENKPQLVLTLLAKKDTPDFSHACSLGFEGVMLTVLSLGLVPQICHQQTDISFSISSVDNKEAIDIDMPSERKSIVGWLAVVYNISPQWSHQYPEDKEQKMIIAAIHRHSAEILKLLPSQYPENTR